MKKRVSLLLVVAMVVSLLVCMSAPMAKAEELKQLTAIASCNPATKDLNESAFLKDLATKAGISVTYECVYSDWDVKKATLLASGDLPDMFFGWNVLTIPEIMANKDYFAPLDELIAANAPDIKKAIDTDSAFKNLVTGLDGTIYYLGCRAPFRPVTYSSVFINKEWMDKLGQTMPTTTEEFEKVLAAFRDGDPNGNGEPDELPLYMGMLRNDDAWGIRCFMGSFGCESSIDTLFAREGDTVIYRPMTDQFKDYMNWLAHLKAEGLMAEELASADWNTRMGRITSDTALVGVTNLWTKALLPAATRDQYVQLPPLKGPKGDQYVAYNPISPVYDATPKFALSAACEAKEAAMVFINSFFTNENAVQINIGPIGTTLLDEGGKLVLQQPPEGMDSDTWIYSNSMRESWPFYVTQEYTDTAMEIPFHDAEKLEYDAVNKPFIRQPDAYLPPLKFDDATNEELAPLQNEIETYMYTTLMDWFVNGGVDDGWQAYIDEMKNIGIDRYIEIYQKAYDAQK